MGRVTREGFWRAIRRPLLSHALFAALLLAFRLGLRERLAADPRLAVLALVPALPCYLALLAAIDRPLLRGVVGASREALRVREPAPAGRRAEGGGVVPERSQR